MSDAAAANAHIAGGLNALEAMAAEPAPAAPASPAAPATPAPAPVETPPVPNLKPNEAPAPVADTPPVPGPAAPKPAEPKQAPVVDDLDDKLFFEHEGKRYYTQKGLDQFVTQRAAKVKDERILEQAKEIADQQLKDMREEHEKLQKEANEARFYLKAKELAAKYDGVTETVLVKLGEKGVKAEDLEEFAKELSSLRPADSASNIQHQALGGAASQVGDPFGELDTFTATRGAANE